MQGHTHTLLSGGGGNFGVSPITEWANDPVSWSNTGNVNFGRTSSVTRGKRKAVKFVIKVI